MAAEVAARLYGLKSSDVAEALFAREAEGSTGLGSGVAAPHARLAGLDRVRGVFIRLEAPVAFDSVDDQPVDLVFVLLAPDDDTNEHLRALARVSRAFRRPNLREQLRQARTQDALHVLLAQDATASAA